MWTNIRGKLQASLQFETEDWNVTAEGLAIIAITLMLALLVKKEWPGLAWLGTVIAADLLPFALLERDGPRLSQLLPHLISIVLLYSIFRAIRRRNDGDNGVRWAIVAWQFCSLCTFISLTFYDGVDYNWWNWIIILPGNAFLGEIWPIYWLIIRPIFGH